MSIVGVLPYHCRDCQNRFLLSRYSVTEPAEFANRSREREVVATRAALGRRRKHREILLYGLALLLFAAILYYLTRSPSDGA